MSQTTDIPNFENLFDLVLFVWLCADDQNTVQQIDRQAMRAAEFCTPDSRHTAVGCHDDQWCKVPLKSTVEERKALDIEHVHFVDEQYLVQMSVGPHKGNIGKLTPGTISALPSSLHSATLVLI